MNFLTHIDAAKREILAADSIVKGIDLRNKAIAMRQLGHAARDRELVNFATEYQLRVERRLGEMLNSAELHKGGRPSKTDDTPVNGLRLRELDIDPRLSSRAQRIASVPEERFEAVLAEAREGEKEITRRAVEKLIAASERADMPKPTLPAGKFRIIYADPPWRYGDEFLISGYKISAELHYPTMSIEELCELNVKELAADNAALFIWTTSPLLDETFEVIQAWGFEYKTSFVWDKVRHNFGHYNSVRHEFLLVCTRGSCIPDSKELHDSVIEIERTNHSAKPPYFRELIDKMYLPQGRDRIELFARGEIPSHWSTWGNEL